MIANQRGQVVCYMAFTVSVELAAKILHFPTVSVTDPGGWFVHNRVTRLKPLLRAYASPLRRSSTSLTPGNSATTGGVTPELGLLSTTMISTVWCDT